MVHLRWGLGDDAGQTWQGCMLRPNNPMYVASNKGGPEGQGGEPDPIKAVTNSP